MLICSFNTSLVVPSISVTIAESFPDKAFKELNDKVKHILAVEMSTGQMLDDVKIANEFKRPVHFYGRVGGIVPEAEEVVAQVLKIIGGEDNA